MSTGERLCKCEVGEGMISSSGVDACEPCERGRWKDARGNYKCQECKDATWTTPGIGSASIDSCVCSIGYYKAPTLNTSAETGLTQTQYLPSGAISYDCFKCEDAWAPGLSDATNCTYIGIEIEEMPIKAGFYRERNISRVVRSCPNGEACVGGTNPDDQCHETQRGVYCGQCAPSYHSGGGAEELCVKCEGNEELSIINSLTAVFVPLIFIMILNRKFNKCTKQLILDRLPMTVEVPSGEDPEDVWAMQLERARKELAEDRPHTFGFLSWLSKKSKSFGVRAKILISLLQVMNGVGVVFEISYPPFFLSILEFFGTITFINIDLPTLMPLGCIFPVDFFVSLVSKTAVPLVIIVGFFVAAWAANKYLAGTSSDEWDQDADGEIDRDEFMQAQPQGKFISDACSSTGFFLIFLLYPSASVAVFQFFVCGKFNGTGESGYRFLLKDYSIDCDGERYNSWMLFIVSMIIGYPVGVPMFYTLQLFINRHDLDRLQRFQIEQEDIVAEKKARRNTVSELTISEFERAELMRLLEEAEIERVEKKQESLNRSLPTAVKKLTNGYTWRCYWFEIFECVRKIAIIGGPIIFDPGTVEQRTMGMVICFCTAVLLAWFHPYEDPADQQVALLCQFDIFFIMIAGMVLEINPDSPLVDAALSAMTILLTLGTIFAEMLDGMGPVEWLTALMGFEEAEESGTTLDELKREKKTDSPYVEKAKSFEYKI